MPRSLAVELNRKNFGKQKKEVREEREEQRSTKTSDGGENLTARLEDEVGPLWMMISKST
jgi:ribosomal protein L9